MARQSANFNPPANATTGGLSPTKWLRAGRTGAAILILIAVPCFATLPWSIDRYEGKAGDEAHARQGPSQHHPLGTDVLGRSLLWRCLLGGAISLGVGASAAVIAVAIGVLWGAIAGLAGGFTDALMMRIVDVLYGLPYILLVVLLDLALSPAVEQMLRWSLPMGTADSAASLADVVTLLVAIGGLSWLTMARVIRGQVLSLRAQPFVEAARASGVATSGILCRHLLPNLMGPIVVYATLTIPTAILAESTLSFLGIGVQAPLPSWGNLASEGISELHALSLPGANLKWWLIIWPCVLLGLTLLALNLSGDRLREKLDPRST